MNPRSDTPQAVPAARRPGRPAGRRTGDPQSREKILAAAKRQFADRAYLGTTIRGVAAEAGLDPAVVHHYFGTKRALFTACIELPTEFLTALSTLVGTQDADLGERIAKLYLGLWDNPATGPQLRAMVRSAMSDDEAAEVLREFLTATVLRPVAAAIGRPDAPLRLALAASQLVGLAAARNLLGIAPLAEAEVDDLAAWVAPAIQRYLTGPAPK
ncbi:TetR family transcriptional regulator [Catenulispora subtropica]|uniref:TetR family transcriptional regulator n=1 Tax=Catenulispora subtropica TaxID=450798 RepID=A0ABP5EA64_9ACTN